MGGAAAIISSRQPYPVLNELGAQERQAPYACLASGAMAAAAARPVDVFDASPDRVLAAMSRDLARQGWRQAWQDKEPTRFSRQSKTGPEVADFMRPATFQPSRMPWP